jgi:hypothetical protein
LYALGYLVEGIVIHFYSCAVAWCLRGGVLGLLENYLERDVKIDDELLDSNWDDDWGESMLEGG